MLGRVIALNWQVAPLMYSAKVLLTLVSGASSIVTAYLAGVLIGELTNAVIHPGGDHGALFTTAIILGVAQFIFYEVGDLSSYLDMLQQFKLDLKIQTSLIHQFARLDQSYYEDSTFNNQLNKVTQNYGSLMDMNSYLFMMVESVVTLISIGIALVALSPLIAALMLVALIPILVVEVRTNMKRWRSWEERGEQRRMQNYISTILKDDRQIKEIKLYGLVDFLLGRWEEVFSDWRNRWLEIGRSARLNRSMGRLLDAIVQISVQLWLLTKALAAGSTLGIKGFVFYRQLLANFAVSGRSVVRNLHSMQEKSLYVNDYFDIMKLKPRLPLPNNGIRLSKELPAITFENVSFSYPQGKEMVLENVSFTIEPGEDVALVGANGAGKSTLIKLLLRLYDPTEGRILVDGHDLREVDLDSWYDQLGVLFQDFNKYSALTVRDTVMMGRVGRKDSLEGVNKAVEDAGAKEFVGKYELGLKQRLNKNYKGGIEPSGGQWQRLALARAFYRGANMLILDEPTSAIDAKGEYEIFQRIAQTQQGKSSLIVSHRFSTVRQANRILVLSGGRIIENGTHEELMKIKGGTYHELFSLQAEAYK